MRRTCTLGPALVGALATGACGGGGASEPPATRGPIESIVHFNGTGVTLYASHHRLELAELPVARFTGGLPARGTIELGANVNVPLGGSGVDLRHARGRFAVRCLGACQLGDDRTPLRPPGRVADLAPDGVPFTHLDLTGLEAHVAIADGHLRLHDWKLASADLELDVALDVTLAASVERSRLDGCVTYRPTEALRARDGTLAAMLDLMTAGTDDAGHHHLVVGGTVAAPRVTPGRCGRGATP